MSSFVIVFLLSITSSFVWGIESYSIELSDIKNGKLQYKISKKNEGWQIIKNTNLFDGGFRIGELKINNSTDIIKELKELKGYYELLTRIDLDMGGVKVPGGNAFKHQRYYKLGEFTVDGVDPYFADITRIFDRIHKKIKLRLIKGVSARKIKGEVFIEKYKEGKKEGKQEKVKCSTRVVCVLSTDGTFFY